MTPKTLKHNTISFSKHLNPKIIDGDITFNEPGAIVDHEQFVSIRSKKGSVDIIDLKETIGGIFGKKGVNIRPADATIGATSSYCSINAHNGPVTSNAKSHRGSIRAGKDIITTNPEATIGRSVNDDISLTSIIGNIYTNARSVDGDIFLQEYGNNVFIIGENAFKETPLSDHKREITVPEGTVYLVETEAPESHEIVGANEIKEINRDEFRQLAGDEIASKFYS